MEFLTESLSSISCSIVPYQFKEEFVAVSSISADISIKTNYEIDAVVDSNPLILADREKALGIMASLLSSIQQFKQNIQDNILSGPVCPYQKTLNEYLGLDFKCPSIHSLTILPDYSVEKAVGLLTNIGDKHTDQMLTHLAVMTAEAADTGFPGITSQHLGNAFAVLSTTTNGQEYVINKPKLAKHLEFAEIVKSIPVEYIKQNPVIVAQKLVSRYIEINQD